MTEPTQHGTPARASRRRVVAGAAWAVPVIGAAAAAPMATASGGGTGGIYGQCDSGAAGHFVLDVSGATPNSSLQVVVTHNGTSSSVNAVFASANWHLVGSSANSYTFSVDVDATGHAGGVLNLSLVVLLDETISVAATVTSLDGVITPHPQGAFAKRRPGFSPSAYVCAGQDTLPA